MRVVRERLIDLARRETQRRDTRGGLLAAYIIGSVAQGEPFVGGSADVDLVLVHRDQPTPHREMLPLTPEIHLDIAHHTRDEYVQPRLLRVHPWLGPALVEPVVLYDPDRFFEWVQAGTRGQFHRPDHAFARARGFLDSAHKARERLDGNGAWPRDYCLAVMDAANAAACLVGPPAVGRRAAVILAQRSAALGHPEVYQAFLRLTGADTSTGWQVPEWLGAWARAFDAASGTSADPQLAACRRAYHLNALQALAESGEAESLIWPLLSAWQRVMATLEASELASEHRAAWEAFLARLRISPRDAALRAAELDVYLEHIQAVVEAWAEQKGA